MNGLRHISIARWLMSARGSINIHHWTLYTVPRSLAAREFNTENKKGRPFKVLGLQQVAIGSLDKVSKHDEKKQKIKKQKSLSNPSMLLFGTPRSTRYDRDPCPDCGLTC